MRTVIICLLACLPTVIHAQPAPVASVEAQLCRSQLDLLTSGNKLTEEETARFQSQCTCLENRTDNDTSKCAQASGDL